MCSVGAALAGLRSASGVVHEKHWHDQAHLFCEIQSRQSTLKTFDEISGHVVITLAKECSSHGIFIQLDANVDIQVEIKVGMQESSTYKEKKGLFHSSETRGNGFIRSPVRQYLVKTEHRFQPIVKLLPGRYTYPFKLIMPPDALPAPFHFKFGDLKYKLTVYMKNPCCCQMMAEKQLEFSGYNNLSLLQNGEEPLVHECGLSASLFSSKQSIKAVLTAEKRCFLPKEEIIFVLTIINPKLYLVKNVIAFLSQKSIYNANWRKKNTLIELNSFESTEMSNEAEINCIGKLYVPENCVPSYNISPLWVYTVLHLIQYEVQVEGRSTPLKGEAEIVIGTTRNTEEDLKRKVQRRSSTSPCLFPGGNPPFSPSMLRRPRSNSFMSRIASISGISMPSPPPAYSQRAASLHSIETLSPHYEELP